MNGSEDLALLPDGLVILSSVSAFFRLFARVNLSVQHALKQHFCQKLVNLVNNVSCRLILCFLNIEKAFPKFFMLWMNDTLPHPPQ